MTLYILVKAHKWCCELKSTEFCVTPSSFQSLSIYMLCSNPWLQFFKQDSQTAALDPEGHCPLLGLSKGAPRSLDNCVVLTSAGTRTHHSLALAYSCFLEFEGSPWFLIYPSVLKRQFLFLPLSESIPGEEAADRFCSKETGFDVQGFR